jgi:hypothetical protein
LGPSLQLLGHRHMGREANTGGRGSGHALIRQGLGLGPSFQQLGHRHMGREANAGGRGSGHRHFLGARRPRGTDREEDTTALRRRNLPTRPWISDRPGGAAPGTRHIRGPPALGEAGLHLARGDATRFLRLQLACDTDAWRQGAQSSAGSSGRDNCVAPPWATVVGESAGRDAREQGAWREG